MSVMQKVKITVMRMASYDDLSFKYENQIEHACDMILGKVFVYDGTSKPDGMCDSAWESLYPFAHALSQGEGNFFDGWMKDPYSAMVSCNDGFRPVSFYLELYKEKDV